MTGVAVLTGAPPADLADELARFERQFTYPLGPGRTFRIDHGADYPRFFRAMGPAAVAVARRDGRVVGTLGVALRGLVEPGGGHRAAAYLGDLKIAPAARGGRVLRDLAGAARDWVGPRADAAYAVVMGGTPLAPDRYTGRVGLPAFREVGRVTVLRVAASAAGPPGGEWLASAEAARAALPAHVRGRYHASHGSPAERSETPPVGLAAPDGSACGWVEDTLRAKRLVADDGAELRSAHLSGFGYATPAAGAALLRAAAGVAAGRSFPGLFVAVPAEDAGPFRALLADVLLAVAPAAVYGAELEPGPWAVNTSEI